MKALRLYTHTHTHTNDLRKEKGITLVALVVTIVVLLILAGVTINLVVGQNGLINRAKEAAQKTKNATESEMQGMDDLATQLAALSNTRSVFEGGNWNSTLGICTPKLGNNMVGVYWSDGSKNDNGTYKASLTSTEMEITSDQEGFSWNDWYNYRAETTEKLDSKQSRWANSKSTVDGSYFVWIPRYEYKILSGEHTSTAGKIDVQFINNNITTATEEGYKVHPAFTTNLALGGWDKEISGIWVAKYEMSMEQTTDNGKSWNNIEVTSNMGNKAINKIVRAVSKPSQYAWNYIDISNCFSNSLNYSTLQLTGSNSHLMKNSEWGAVAYLTHSKYGRNENEIAVNNYYKDKDNQAKLTGFSTGLTNTKSVNDKSDENNKYNGKNGMLSSTTGNIYGIYDMSGGNWEYVSGIYSMGGSGNLNSLYDNVQYRLQENGVLNKLPDNNDSTKYVTVYPTTDKGKDDANMVLHYEDWKNMYGDAIYETSEKVPGINGAWNNDLAVDENYQNTYYPAFMRGGSSLDDFSDHKSSTGVFAFDEGGNRYSYVRISNNTNL